jgi:hypothetical protein
MAHSPSSKKPTFDEIKRIHIFQIPFNKWYDEVTKPYKYSQQIRLLNTIFHDPTERTLQLQTITSTSGSKNFETFAEFYWKDCLRGRLSRIFFNQETLFCSDWFEITPFICPIPNNTEQAITDIITPLYQKLRQDTSVEGLLKFYLFLQATSQQGIWFYFSGLTVYFSDILEIALKGSYALKISHRASSPELQFGLSLQNNQDKEKETSVDTKTGKKVPGEFVIQLQWTVFIDADDQNRFKIKNLRFITTTNSPFFQKKFKTLLTALEPWDAEAALRRGIANPPCDLILNASEDIEKALFKIVPFSEEGHRPPASPPSSSRISISATNLSTTPPPSNFAAAANSE